MKPFDSIDWIQCIWGKRKISKWVFNSLHYLVLIDFAPLFCVNCELFKGVTAFFKIYNWLQMLLSCFLPQFVSERHQLQLSLQHHLNQWRNHQHSTYWTVWFFCIMWLFEKKKIWLRGYVQNILFVKIKWKCTKSLLFWDIKIFWKYLWCFFVVELLPLKESIYT